MIAIAVIATAGMVLARELWIGRQTSELAQQAALGPHVLVAQVGRTPATRDIKLPATTRGFDETEIYAKVPGYIKSILVDKGDHVHAGELLATDRVAGNRPAGPQRAGRLPDRQDHR